jgi:hypothetical protein
VQQGWERLSELMPSPGRAVRRCGLGGRAHQLTVICNMRGWGSSQLSAVTATMATAVTVLTLPSHTEEHRLKQAKALLLMRRTCNL